MVCSKTIKSQQFLEFYFYGFSAPTAASKYGFLKSNIPANIEFGNVLICVLYGFTASLKRVHEVKIWFSVLANSSCNFKKFSLAFNSGYCSTVTNRDKELLTPEQS
jgi:hypothetical protein